MRKEEKKEVVKKTAKKETNKKEKSVVQKENKKKEKKENIFKIIGRYFRGVFKEIKRIKWTSGKELVKYSIASILFVLFFGLYFYGIDWVALLVRSLAK